MSKQMEYTAGRLRQNETALNRGRVWFEEAGVWVPMHPELVAEIRRQVKLRLDREERRFGGEYDKLALKIPGEILMIQETRKARAAGEPAPIPCL